jgi:hypothetical protein
MRQATFLSTAEALRDTAATLEQQKATFEEDHPHFYELRDRAIDDFGSMVTGRDTIPGEAPEEVVYEPYPLSFGSAHHRQCTLTHPPPATELSDEEQRGIAVKKGLPVRKRSWLWWCNSGINFPRRAVHHLHRAHDQHLTFFF